MRSCRPQINKHLPYTCTSKALTVVIARYSGVGRAVFGRPVYTFMARNPVQVCFSPIKHSMRFDESDFLQRQNYLVFSSSPPIDSLFSKISCSIQPNTHERTLKTGGYDIPSSRTAAALFFRCGGNF